MVFFYSNHDVKESTLCVLCTEAVDKEEAVILTEKGSVNIKISQITLDSTPSKLRSRQKFNFQNDCLFCGQNVVKQGTREKWHPVLTLEFQSTLLGVVRGGMTIGPES